MKKLKLLLILSIALSSLSCEAQTNKQEIKKTKSDKVEVFYFHFTRRCNTCNTVESESKKIIETLYAEEMKNGKITFSSLDFTDKNSSTAIQKAKAVGQSLLIISGNNRIDLTDKAFMYAVSKPEKLKEEIKKAIDPLIY
jgi:hypothetical protein